jgi:hypothetical protein
MRDLKRRMQRLEDQQCLSAATEHCIPVVMTPWFIDEDERTAWMAEARACDCQPDCPGKRVGAVLPAKLSPEEWTVRAEAYYAQRRGSDA